MRACRYLGPYWCGLAMSGSLALIAAIIVAPLLR
jgi:pantoate kinase